MKFTIRFIIALIICVSIWVLVGTTLEHYDVHASWFMIAGFWMYPLYQLFAEVIAGWGD